MSTLAEWRVFADSLAEQVVARDPFWRKCYPCRNNGRCCQGDSPLTLAEEAAEIIALLEASPPLREKVLLRLRAGRNCIFYDQDASACLVHEIRPLMCRLTPLKAFSQGDELTVFDGAANSLCGSFLKRHLDVQARDGFFVQAGGNTYILADSFFRGEEPGLDLSSALPVQNLLLRKYPA